MPSVLDDVKLINAAIQALPWGARILIRAPYTWSQRNPLAYAALLALFGFLVGTIVCVDVMAGKL